MPVRKAACKDIKYDEETYFFKMKRRTMMIERPNAAMIGPMTQTIPASSVFLLTETSPECEGGRLGSGLLGGSPGGADLMSRDRASEKGLLV